MIRNILEDYAYRSILAFCCFSKTCRDLLRTARKRRREERTAGQVMYAFECIVYAY